MITIIIIVRITMIKIMINIKLHKVLKYKPYIITVPNSYIMISYINIR